MIAKKKICKRCAVEKYIYARGLCKSCDMIKKPHKYLIKRNKEQKLVSKIKTKKESIATLKKQLDDIFSLYIRLKYCDSNGLVKCFTCGVYKPYKGGGNLGIQNGHFWSRKDSSVRFDEDNCRPQCYQCNVVKSGNYPIYAVRLINEIGIDKFNLLEVKKNSTNKINSFEYNLLISEYTKKVETLKQKLEL